MKKATNNETMKETKKASATPKATPKEKKVEMKLQKAELKDIGNTGLLYLSARIKGGFFLRFLIDSGCSQSVVADYVTVHFKHVFKKIEMNGKNMISGIGGDSYEAVCFEGAIQVLDQEFPTVFNATSLPGVDGLEIETGIQIHGILGIDFMKKHHVLLAPADKGLLFALPTLSSDSPPKEEEKPVEEKKKRKSKKTEKDDDNRQVA